MKIQDRVLINQIRGLAVSGSTGAGIPKPVTDVQASVSNASKGATSVVTVQFHRNPLDSSFTGVIIYAKGYQGNQSPVQVGASADSPTTLVLNNTGESITLIIQSRGNSGRTPLSNCPAVGVKLPKGSGGGFGNQTTTQTVTSTVQSTLSEFDLRKLTDGMFLAFAHTNATPETVTGFLSLDGIKWSTYGTAPIVSPNERDPAALHYDSQWWIAATASRSGATSTFDLFSSSDLDTWSGPTAVSTAGGFTPNNTWAPQWFVDDDNSVHVLVALNSSGSISPGTFQIYELHPTNRSMTTWSSPVALAGSGFPASCIDPTVAKIGNTYYLLFKDNATGYVDMATSTSLTSGWTVTKTGNWASWAQSSGTIEGPKLVQMDDGKWRVYFTNNNGLSALGIYYSETIDTTLATGWSAPILLTSFNTYNHPVPIRVYGTAELLDSSGFIPPAKLANYGVGFGGVSFSTVATPGSLNLSNVGTLDWFVLNGSLYDPARAQSGLLVHSKQTGGWIKESFDWLNGSGSTVSLVAGGGTGVALSSNSSDDMAPALAATAPNLSVIRSTASPTNYGYRFRVPAFMATHTLKLGIGINSVKVTITCSMSDGSVANQTTTLDAGSAGTYVQKEVDITYNAGSNNAWMTVTVEVTTNYGGSVEDVGFIYATLA